MRSASVGNALALMRESNCGFTTPLLSSLMGGSLTGADEGGATAAAAVFEFVLALAAGAFVEAALALWAWASR